ncbi:MAG: hypothetical protein ACRELS_20600 [Candidatus Rokuibacteriota bacterium]
MTALSRRRFLATSATVVAAGLEPKPARAQAVKIGTAVLGDDAMAGPVIIAREKEHVSREFVPVRS